MTVPLTTALSQMADGLAHLIGEHFALARLELERDARKAGAAAARLGLFAQVALLGYGALCAGAAFALSRWLGLAGAFALVGGLNLAIAAWGLAAAAKKLKSNIPLRQSMGEVSRSAALLEATRGG